MKELFVAARRAGLGLGLVTAVVLWAAPVQAAVINLFDYGFNIDGTVSVPTLGDPVPAAANIGGFDDITGLGTIEVTLSGAGAHNVDLFVDHEIDEAINTFFNEAGAATGAPAGGQSWEIDEPGFGSGQDGSGGVPYFGDIFSNFSASLLDDQIFFDAVDSQSLGSPDDVSMALGWDFVLSAGETATIDFVLSETMPAGGFYLTHTDPDSNNASIYFSSSLDITSGPGQIPEPGTLSMLALGALAWGAASVRRRREA